MPDQHEFERDVDHKGDQRDAHRRDRVVARIESGRDDPHQRHGGKSHAIGRQRQRRQRRRIRIERAMREHGPHDGVRDQHKGEHERQRQQQAHCGGAVLRRVRSRAVAIRQPRRHGRQQHRAQRDAQHAQRQLVDAVGIIERRAAAGDQIAGQDRVQQRGDHGAGRAQRYRPEGSEELFDLGRPARPGQPQPQAFLRARPPNEAKLRHPARQHAPGSGIGRIGKPLPQQQRRDHGKIEQVGPGRARPEAVNGVQHRRQLHRHQRQDQIGKRHPRQVHCHGELLRIVGKARRHQPHDLRHENHRQHQQRDLRRHLPGENIAGEAGGFFLFAFGMQRGIARQEGGVDRAFAENGAEIIGKQKRDKERVRQHARAQRPGQQGVARKAGDARHQSEAADRKQPPEHQRTFPVCWTSFFNSGSMRATITFTPSGLGWMPSARLSFRFSATPSSMKG